MRYLSSERHHEKNEHALKHLRRGICVATAGVGRVTRILIGTRLEKMNEPELTKKTKPRVWLSYKGCEIRAFRAPSRMFRFRPRRKPTTSCFRRR